VNKEAYNLLGYSPSELLSVAVLSDASQLSLLSALHVPEHRDLIEILHEECCTLGRKGYHRVVGITRADGTVATMLEIAKYRLSKNGSLHSLDYYFVPLVSRGM
jgi:hypothetical protein